jgi:hypothetical protein
VSVYLGWFGRATTLVHYGSVLTAPASRLPGVHKALDAAARRIQRSRGAPETTTAIRSDVVAVAGDASGRELVTVHLVGGDPYSFTASILAWAAVCVPDRRRHDGPGATAQNQGGEAAMNMLPRDRAEQILADHAAGKPVGAIARAYGHSPATISAYVNGLRTPGEAAPRAGDFAPFAAYCRQRLADDPHLRTPALLTELSILGIGNARSTLYHALDRHGIQAHPCPGCHPASMSGYAPLAAPRGPWPAPLPVPAAPVAGEALASFLGRLAAANRTTPGAVLDILPPWFRVKARWPPSARHAGSSGAAPSSS